jgi:hypothetical protein
MKLAQFIEQCSECLPDMTLDEAINFVQDIQSRIFKPVLRMWNNEAQYRQRVAERIACTELLEALHDAPPWKTYKDILAVKIWTYMKRVTLHGGEYEGCLGKRVAEADRWYLDNWKAFTTIFELFSGGEIPKRHTCWKRYWIALGYSEDQIERRINSMT